MADEKVVDERDTMKYLYTLKLASGKVVDVYEVRPNVIKLIFRKEEKKGGEGYKLVPE